MDKKPILLRTLICLAVVAVFACAMIPLTPRDYYDVFVSMLKDKKDPEALALIRDAKERQAKDPNLFQSQALLMAADNAGIDLASKINADDVHNNREVMSLIRKNASGSIRLGLDLNGGVEFYLELVPDPKADPEKRAMIEEDFDHYRDVAIEQLRKRLEGSNIFEAELAPSGARHIVLRAPIVTADEKAQLRDMIQMSAKLEFRLVDDTATPEDLARYKADPSSVPPGTEYLEVTDVDPKTRKPVVRGYLVELQPQMDGRNIDQARAVRTEFGQRQISLRFNAQGAEDFRRVTAACVHKQLAIVLDGKLYCAPSVNEAIGGGSAVITGSFTEDECKNIANALQAGSFPFTIKVSALFDTDPKLGAASVRNGIWVGLISLCLVALFMLIYYRASGLIAVAALSLNIVLILGAMAAFDCTLTLPGIAGIVLTIGMAVDANVLIYERIREELQSGKKLRSAVDAGYERALSAVLDSNITTLITAFILMYVGTGAVKGFAVTLCIGILTTLFTALFVTRLIFDYLFRFFHLEKISMMHIFGAPKFNFVRFWKYPLMLSLAMILLTFVLLGIKGKKVLGIDFTGGTSLTYSYDKKGDTAKLAKALADAGYVEPSVTYKSNITAADGEKDILEVLLRSGDDSAELDKNVADLLAAQFPDLGIRQNSQAAQHLDGLIGREFIKAAVLAVVLALVGIALYIIIRYEFVFAFASVAALLHDVLVVLAIYLLLGNTIQLTTVAAFLTVLGYSINDTVVIFDRIRENMKLGTCSDWESAVNRSVNQTLSRTMITSITTFIVVFVLWLAGGSALNDFSLVMMLGVLIGTYSSVFLASPFMLLLRRMKKERKEA